MSLWRFSEVPIFQIGYIILNQAVCQADRGILFSPGQGLKETMDPIYMGIRVEQAFANSYKKLLTFLPMIENQIS
jgi:hypothetical protein